MLLTITEADREAIRAALRLYNEAEFKLGEALERTKVRDLVHDAIMAASDSDSDAAWVAEQVVKGKWKAFEIYK